MDNALNVAESEDNDSTSTPSPEEGLTLALVFILSFFKTLSKLFGNNLPEQKFWNPDKSKLL